MFGINSSLLALLSLFSQEEPKVHITLSLCSDLTLIDIDTVSHCLLSSSQAVNFLLSCPDLQTSCVKHEQSEYLSQNDIPASGPICFPKRRVIVLTKISRHIPRLVLLV